MTRTVSIDFGPARKGRATRTSRRHSLARCEATGLPRFRDRHQARAGIRAMEVPAHSHLSLFACPSCRGFHIDVSETAPMPIVAAAATPVEPFNASLSSRRRRFFMIDLENPTRGAKATPADVAKLWRLIKEQAPGIAPRDHVVIGTSRAVAVRYRPAIEGPNVRWVVGADAKDGADRALLAAINVFDVARRYDELVVVSGDHAFAPLARRAKQLGLAVHVVTAEQPNGRSMLSRELSNAADVHTVVRLRGKSQRLQAASAARTMSATWRRDHSLAA
jgi:NYN domain